MNRIAKYITIGIFSYFIFWGNNSFAQTKAEIKVARKLFEGSWVNKKAKRHLTISFDTQDYATINDWHGKWSQDNNTIDAYKAFVMNSKLVMPEDKTDLRSPYCEIVRKGNTLLYRCREMNTKDKKFVEEILFIREKD
ncbi:hypothetical protein SAMN05216464_110156 [Mucilaginibacter pineti]|uniref:Uncharacterized protein n=1 Tax=Mucilaginibacter pineti TaxID=1391627 RepID=A0A1G7GIG6_9SPHI|nr:hypothetical protein [Mucilaginibacter pineti]SDE87799.1 hypothetical protein SAMN05216464_110156 [Mucilaginibacter pineti]